MEDTTKQISSEAEIAKHELDTLQRKLDDSCREREILKKSLNQLTDTSKATCDLILLLQSIY